MAKLQVTNGVHIRLIWTVGGTPWAINVLGARNDGLVPINQATADTLGAAIKSAFGATGGLAAHIGANIALSKVGIRDLNTVSLPEYVDGGAAVPGTSAAKTLPFLIALVVTWRTGQVGKDFRGRTYLFGFDETSSDGNTANADTTTDALAFANGIKSAVSASGMQLALIHRALPQRTDSSGQTLPARPSGTVPITVPEMKDSLWDVQRRRKDAA